MCVYVHLYMVPIVEDEEEEEIAVAESTFSSDIGALLNSKKNHDVKFMVETKPLYAQKLILCEKKGKKKKTKKKKEENQHIGECHPHGTSAYTCILYVYVH